MYQFDRAVLASFDDELLALSKNINDFLERDDLSYDDMLAFIAMQKSARALNDYFALTLAKYSALNESSAS